MRLEPKTADGAQTIGVGARKGPISMSDQTPVTTMVVGASRGLGRAIATVLAAAGSPVVAVSRTASTFLAAADGAGTIETEIADASDADVSASLLDRYEPGVVILVAGAVPHMVPPQEQTWESFSVHWQADVRITFQWLREELLRQLRPGSKVVVFSSGAALNGSPLSGVRRSHRTRPGWSGVPRGSHTI